MVEYVSYLFDTFLPDIVNGSGVSVPDDEEEMNWRLFFAHSQDMQGFRADIFTGGQNEEPHPKDRTYIGLRPRWNADSFSLILDLSTLWEDSSTRQELIRITGNTVSPSEKTKGVRLGLDVLQSSNVRGAHVFADALEALTGYKIARKTNKMIRAYVENSYRLKPFGCSLRKYIRSNSPNSSFPPSGLLDVNVEQKWALSLQSPNFYNVGPTLAPYILSDWLLGLWLGGRIHSFSLYKPDSVHLRVVEDGRLPLRAATNFVEFCSQLIIPEGFGAISGKPCPPRILNECIWLDNNTSTKLAKNLSDG